MLKACREAKQQTSWLHPDLNYEAAVRSYVAGTLQDAEFRARLLRFCRRIEPYAACKALAQLVLKACAPGIPDTYQGSELWHQVLVDPDNRRAVDYDLLGKALNTLDESRTDPRALLGELRSKYADGRLKLLVSSRLLRLRAAEPSLFQSGYTPLDAGESCVAFGRGASGCDLICAVTRFPFRVTRGRAPWPLGGHWGTIALKGEGIGGRYREIFSGRTLEVEKQLQLSELFADLPIAVLVRV